MKPSIAPWTFWKGDTMPLSENQAKVLAALLVQPRSPRSVRGISELVEVSQRTTTRALIKLEDSGLAQATDRGWRITSTGRALFNKPVYGEYGAAEASPSRGGESEKETERKG